MIFQIRSEKVNAARAKFDAALESSDNDITLLTQLGEEYDETLTEYLRELDTEIDAAAYARGESVYHCINPPSEGDRNALAEDWTRRHEQAIEERKRIEQELHMRQAK